MYTSHLAHAKALSGATAAATPPAERSATLAPHTIATVRNTSARGLHSPVLTHGGLPIMDGVVTSFDRIESVTLASYLLPYAEPLLEIYDWYSYDELLG